ncbi:hypothetical protein Tco_1560342 [Tanacetum coccineum]
MKEKSLIYNTSFLGEYECSSLALDRRRKKGEDEIGSLETRLNYAGKSNVSCGQSRRSQIYLGVVLPIRGPPLGRRLSHLDKEKTRDATEN